jgi:hypothetical protein
VETAIASQSPAREPALPEECGQGASWLQGGLSVPSAVNLHFATCQNASCKLQNKPHTVVRRIELFKKRIEYGPNAPCLDSRSFPAAYGNIRTVTGKNNAQTR